MEESTDLRIDAATGQVTLPNGATIEESLTLARFRATPWGASARSRAGALDWMHQDVGGGEVDGRPLLMSLCFCGELLVSVSLTVDLYPPEAVGWESYSMAVETRTKQRHDERLTEQLGPPHRSELVAGREESILARPFVWEFAWGEVRSCHDAKGGGTSILVSYGDRRRECLERREPGAR